MTKAKKEENQQDDMKDLDNILSENEKSLFDVLEKGESSELFDVINQMMTAGEDLDLKTEIKNPRAEAVIEVVIQFCEDNNLKKPAKTLKTFLLYYHRFMVSYERGGRKEMVEVLKENKKELGDIEVVD